MTKENAILTYAAWGTAGLIILLWQKKLKFLIKSIFFENVVFGFLVSVFLYLFFFGRSLDLIISPFLLLKRGLIMHLKPWYYFITLLFLHEFFLLILGVIAGIFITFKKLWTPRLVFFFLWFLLILTIYSLIPYKTPWLISSIILPLGLFTVFAVSAVWRNISKITKFLFVFFIIVLLLVSLVRLWSDNFIHPDRAGKYDYAYLQGGTGFHEFLAVLEGISSLNKNETLPLQIIGNYDELLYIITEKYDRQNEPFVPNLPVYINYWHDAQEMKKMLSQTGYDYVFLKFTYFVPGPDMDIFIRKDKWDAYKSSPNFVAPSTIWADGTMRYH